MRCLAILRGLLSRALFSFGILCAFLACASVAHAQSVTVIDGSQTNLVIVGQGNSASGWIAWRSKFIPSHIIFAFELPAGFVAVNPVVWCSLDDQSQGINPNDKTKWIQLLISEPQISSFDVAGPSVSTGGSPQTILVETGVLPCVAWAIQPAGTGNTFNASGTSKVTAVQLPASGDAAFFNAANATTVSSGAVRTIPGTNNPGGNPNGVLTVGGSANKSFNQDAVSGDAVISSDVVSFGPGDASSNTQPFFRGPANQGIININYPYIFDGTNWDRYRSASAANNGTTTGGLTGINLIEKGPRWSANSAPAAGSQGSAVQAAGGAGVQHIADCVTFSAASNAAPAATALNVQLLDGATIKAEWQIEISAAVGQNTPPFQICGLGIIGTANTSMTLQWSAGLANLSETATITGLDVK